MNPPERAELIPTRRSLLSRLKDRSDQKIWRVFFDTYLGLIYGLAIKAGLSESEAHDAVQETIIAVSKQMPTFKLSTALLATPLSLPPMHLTESCFGLGQLFGERGVLRAQH